MNLKKILFAIIIIALIAVVAYFLLGQFEQTKPIQQSINDFAGQAVDTVQNNGVLVGAGASGATSIIGGLALNAVNKAKDAKNSVEVAASTQINGLLKQKEQVEGSLESVKAEVTNTNSKLVDAQKQFEDYKAEVEPLKTKVASLEDQVQTAKDENAQFVMSLMSSANGALVTNPVDGKVYSVLKTPPEIRTQ